jgi:thiosulfate/3-mercaptopyruvate sulfurtransferase
MPHHHQHLIEPAELADLTGPVLLVDLCSDRQYQQGHIPGAVHVSPAELVAGRPPVPGQLPDQHRLGELFSRIGLEEGTTVVVYDDEGGGWAGRMAWTLDVIGHRNWRYLNGGLQAWLLEGRPLETTPVTARAAPRDIEIHRAAIAEAEEIMARLGDGELLVWDARSRGEYEGSKVVAKRGGHIPGAIHCEWTDLMDPARGLRIRGDAAAILAAKGLTPDKEIVTHCQSHHRSGFTYLVARVLGYPRIRAYPGSWGDWGNRADTPVESGL